MVRGDRSLISRDLNVYKFYYISYITKFLQTNRNRNLAQPTPTPSEYYPRIQIHSWPIMIYWYEDIRLSRRCIEIGHRISVLDSEYPLASILPSEEVVVKRHPKPSKM